MTHIYDFNTVPETFTIRCPRCEAAAEFRFPFTLLGAHLTTHPKERAIAEAMQLDPNVKVEQWGGWTVLVHFPNIYPWQPPPAGEGYRRGEHGVSICPQCGHKGKHELSWPEDAYFNCEFKGQQLWAWTRGHARALKSYVDSKDRNVWHYPGYALFLLHVPKVFLTTKNRDGVSRRLERMLEL
ncbi:MAG: hypothetical protein ACJ78Q_06680 [Chloroflexia bacterium]